ncbi:MAG: SpoIIE family protein phosphatase [Flavobacteriales bacterium]|nr:SpoIIE family protein phosphatase [Flavobacteriales bacterium]
MAQVYPVRSYSTEQGLNNARITAIAQDIDHFIWVGTDAGVSRTDGRTFINITPKEGLAGDKVTCMVVDADNRLWVGHQEAGISIISRDTIIHITEEQGLANNEVHALLLAVDGSIWAGTFDGITVFKGAESRTIAVEDGLPSANVHALAQDARGRIWAGTFGQGIAIFNGEVSEPFRPARPLPSGHITALCAAHDGMLIATMAGAFRHDAASGQLTTLLSAVGQVNAVTVQGEAVWNATFNGLARVLRDATLQLNEHNGLPHNEVLSLLTDSEGNLWAGTAKGVICIPHAALSHFPADGGRALEANGILKDSKGRIWAGNALGGVKRKEGDHFVNPFKDPDINDRIIGPVAEDRDGNVWFGTRDFGGLYQWDGKRIYNYSDAFGLADNNINALLLLQSGQLLIGTPSGLSTFRDEEFEMVPFVDDPGSAHVTALANADNGRVLIGSLDGTVSEWDGDAVRELRPSSAIKSTVNHLVLTTRGTCIATEGNGLFLLKGGALLHFTDRNGLPDMNVRSAAEVEGHLYIGTAHGIFMLTMEDTSVRATTIDARALGGILECRAGAVLAEGTTLWFGTSRGMMRLQTRELPDITRSPHLFFEGVELFYRHVRWADKGFDPDRVGMPMGLTLPFDENYLRFNFRAISTTDPDRVRYRWRLEGFETEFGPFSSEGMANYPNLPPGSYTLRVQACTGDGACVSEMLSYGFRVRPPFWQTFWFYLLVTVALVAGVYGYIRWRERKLKEEKRLLETTVEERTRQLREQKEIVEEQNTHITESIDYARNIQMAMLPSDEEMQRAFADHFVLYRPKETVGGDFYWMYGNGSTVWAAAVDCTGHGVAGAFMSMIGSDLLNQTIIEKKVTDPAQVLAELDRGIRLAFAQSASEFEGDKGMDVCLVKVEREKGIISFAGAQRPLYVLHGDELTEVEGDQCSVSCVQAPVEAQFTTHRLPLVDNMRIFLFSDGFADQFGGTKGKKFMTRKLKELLIACHDRPMTEQKAALAHAFDSWKGTEYPQLDDILVMGMRL